MCAFFDFCLILFGFIRRNILSLSPLLTYRVFVAMVNILLFHSVNIVSVSTRNIKLCVHFYVTLTIIATSTN